MKNLLGNIYLTFTAKRKKSVVQKFNGILSGAKNYALLMPEDNADFQNALPIAEYLLSKKFHVTLIANNLSMPLLKDKSHYRLEEYFSTDKNRFGFPKIKLMQRLKIYSYDVLISLAKEPSPFQNYCADKLSAGVKIGAALPGNDKIYAVQVSVKDAGRSDFYKIFLNCLQSLY